MSAEIAAQILSEDRKRDPFQTWLPKAEEILKEIIEKVEQEPTMKEREPKKVVQRIEKITVDPIKKIIEPPILTVTGLIWNAQKPQAIVNGQIVSIGDTLKDITIIDIHQKGIEIIFSNKTFIVEIEKNIINPI